MPKWVAYGGGAVAGGKCYFIAFRRMTLAKHTRRRIREACIAVLDDKSAKPEEKLKAVAMLYKLEISKVKYKPRGKPFPKKNSAGNGIDRISELTGALQ